MANVKSVADWMAEREIDLAALIESSRLDDRVVNAIVGGRYTPSPEQRQRLAAALGVSVEEIAWGHVAPIAHVYGHGPQFEAQSMKEEEAMAENLKNIDELCQEHGIDARELAKRSGVDEQRVVAIVMGRWTPSPEDRDRIATAFGLTRDRISWGHKTPIQHIYGAGPA